VKQNRLLAAPLLALALAGCVRATIAWAPVESEGPPATPPVLGPFESAAPVETRAGWADRAPALRAAFEAAVYGAMPDASSARVVSKTVLDEAAFGGHGRLEEWVVSAAATFGETTVETRGAMGRDGFVIEVALPKDAAGPVPAILVESFCPSWNVMPHPGVARPDDAEDMEGGFFGAVATYVFGRYICTPPIETILEAGYALVEIYPGSVVPDEAEAGLAELKRLSAGHTDEATRWGAVAAWGWVFSRVIDVLEDDPRFDSGATIVWGHSRYGKSALVAAAFDPRVDGVVAHQSGTGGASLSRQKAGESVGEITESYPHWFAPAYAGYAGREEALPVDQHQLLALIAPRPVLLGNARRDVWSDPNGAFKAAEGATPAYRLFGSEGLTAETLKDFRPADHLAYWMRPGTHGVVEEDWPAFLAFLDAHF